MAGLAVDIVGVKLQTPLVLAAGTCGTVLEMGGLGAGALAGAGALTTKSITVEERTGNSPVRIAEARAGMLNAIGLANPGLDAFVADHAPSLSDLPCPVIGSIAGGSIADYQTIAAQFDSIEHLPIVELNVSCPNTDEGCSFATDPGRLGALVAAVRVELKQTKLFVKLPPETRGIEQLADAAVDAGADGLTVANTLEVMAIDVETRASRLTRETMGLSGPAIHQLTVRLVHQVYRSVARDANIPIIGTGGVLDWRDAAEFILAGATAVGVGTALFIDPRASRRIARGLERWVRRQGCESITELIGAYRGPQGE